MLLYPYTEKVDKAAESEDIIPVKLSMERKRIQVVSKLMGLGKEDLAEF